MQVRPRVQGLVCALALAGCSRRDPAASTGSATPPSPPSSTGSNGPLDAGAPAKPAARAKAAAIDAAIVDDPAARAAYRAGMRAGRKATDAKRYADAIAGFDAALAAKPNDARALGERGFARLLEGSDLVAATRDLDAAASGTKDRKLLSTIWFNRGLIDEQREDQANATASFVIANAMRPTKAAAAKLAGKSPCPLQIEHRFAIDDHPAVRAADWMALAIALPHDDDAPPATTEAALDSLTGAKTEPDLPTVISTTTLGERASYAVWRIGDQLLATPLGIAWLGRCYGSVAFEIVSSTSTAVLVHGTETLEGGHTFMCEGKGEELIECTGADGEVAAGTACLGGSPTVRDLVFDRATGAPRLAIEQPESAGPRPTIELAGATVKISGQGCDRAEPF